MRYILSAFFAILLLSSCQKKTNCANTLKLSVDNPTPTIGSSITITATRETDEDVYQWDGPNNLNDWTQINKVTLDPVKLSHSGWYYCNKSNSECNSSLFDSIYIDVQLAQETPPCTTTNNVITASNISGTTVTRTSKRLDPTFNGLALEASGSFGSPTYKILFDSYNGNTEPKDGTYITSNVPIFNIFDELNTVSMSFNYSSNYYHCGGGYKVYVKHVNGKLQVTFCSVPFASPPLPITTCSGKVTEL